MKVTIYNDQFEFSEILKFNENDKFERSIMLYWQGQIEVNKPIESIGTDHPLYGWLECYAQSSHALDIDWTHIKFEK